MSKTKKELELENNFLRLQLKVIKSLIPSVEEMTRSLTLVAERFGAIEYQADSEEYEKRLLFIKERNCPYNFYHENISI